MNISGLEYLNTKTLNRNIEINISNVKVLAKEGT